MKVTSTLPVTLDINQVPPEPTTAAAEGHVTDENARLLTEDAARQTWARLSMRPRTRFPLRGPLPCQRANPLQATSSAAFPPGRLNPTPPIRALPPSISYSGHSLKLMGSFDGVLCR